MRLRHVDPKKIGIPTVRVTSVWDNELLAEFRASIKELGILEPPVVIESDGNLLLVDGQHRVIEAINLGHRRIPVVVMDGDLQECLVQNLALNNLRGKIKPTETAEVIKVLFEEYAMGVDEIAKRTGFSEDKISKLLYLSRATPEVREALDGEGIQLGHAYALGRIEDTEVQNRILSTQLLYRFKVADLEDHIKDVLREKVRMEEAPPLPPPSGPVLVSCYYCGQARPIHQVANPNICIGCSGYLADFVRQAQALREAEQVAHDAQRAPKKENSLPLETL